MILILIWPCCRQPKETQRRKTFVSAHELVLHILRSAGANKDQAADDGLTPLLISAQNNQRLCTQQSRYILLLSLVRPNKRTRTLAQSAKRTSDWVLRRRVCSCIAWNLLDWNIFSNLDQVHFQYLTHLYFNLLFLNSEHSRSRVHNHHIPRHWLQSCLSSCRSICLGIVRRITGSLAMGMLPQSRRDSFRWGGASSAIWCKLEPTLRWRSHGMTDTYNYIMIFMIQYYIHITYLYILYTSYLHLIYILYTSYILYTYYIHIIYIPVVPHKAVAEVSKIGNL